jgi:metal-responsive CopG/Arc/MetJ family transcriptional regulator
MKTIAITMDEPTLEALDRMAGGRRRRGEPGPSRSELVRRAVQEFIARQAQLERESCDRRAITQHRDLLARQAAALVAEQATS